MTSPPLVVKACQVSGVNKSKYAAIDPRTLTSSIPGGPVLDLGPILPVEPLSYLVFFKCPLDSVLKLLVS